MKSIYTFSVFISLISCAYLAPAQVVPINKQQTSIKKTGKVVTKNISFTETEKDNSIYEFGKFDAYVKKHIKTIPGLNGQVLISFTTEKDGSLTHVKIEKSLTKAADEEALRLVKSYTGWAPNTIDGKPQSGKINTSIVFGKIGPKTNAPK